MRILDRPPVPVPVRLAQKWRPSLAQLIEVRPEVRIEKPTIAPQVTVELGGLPLSIGFFIGSGLTFLLRTALPKGWPQTVALVAGGGMAAAGVVNLLLPKAKAAPGAAPPGAPLPQPTIAPVKPGETSAPLPVTTEGAFESAGIRFVSPARGTVVEAGFGAVSVPARLRLSNGAAEQAGFDLVLDINEQPEPFGEAKATKQISRILMAPGESRDVDLEIPVSTWAWNVDKVRVMVFAGKRRLTGGPVEELDHTSFIVD